MKITYTLFILLFLSSFSIIPQKQSLSGKWRLICFQDYIKKENSPKPAESPEGILTFTFSDDGVNGTLSGRTTTNRVSGNYQLSNDNKINISSFGGTKINEMGWGYNIWTTMYQSSSYKFSNDTLTILYDNDSKGMQFILIVD